MRKVSLFALTGLAVATCGLSAQAAWLAPTGGWQLTYQASDGRPDAATVSPKWTGYQYQTTNPGAVVAGGVYANVMPDAVSGEQTLYMENIGTANPAQNANWGLTSGAGIGTSSDTITMDFRFRIVDETVAATQYQLQFIVLRPSPTAGKQHLYLLNLAAGRVGGSTPTSGVGATQTTNLGYGWHDARWMIDVAANTANLRLDGAETAIFAHAGLIGDGTGNRLQFGDGTSAVFGKANVSDIRLTNSEFAAVPEPASLGLLALSGLMLGRRRQAI